MEVCYCGNSEIFKGILLSLLSLREKSTESLRVYLLTGDFSFLDPSYVPIREEQRLFLEKTLQEKNPQSQVLLFDETVLFLQKFLHSPNLKTRYTPYSMLRLIFDLEKRLPSRLLYLDADTVFLQDPVGLYHLHFAGHDRAMALDAVYSFLFDEHYCNSGVILFNLDAERKDGLLEKGRVLLNQTKFTMPDQEAFNRILPEDILILPRYYNEQRQIYPETVIRHYCQQIRPWPVIHVEKAKPWEGERYRKAYPKEAHEELLRLFEIKKKEFKG